MNINNFNDELADILEVSIEKIYMDCKLSEFKSWDSLAMMTFVVVFRDKVKRDINPMAVAKCLKVSDLFNLIK